MPEQSGHGGPAQGDRALHCQWRRRESGARMDMTVSISKSWYRPRLSLRVVWRAASTDVCVRALTVPNPARRTTLPVVLPAGLYYVSVGLFSGDGNSRLYWAPREQFVTIPAPRRPLHPSDIRISARTAFQQWRRAAIPAMRGAPLTLQALALLISAAFQEPQLFHALWQTLAPGPQSGRTLLVPPQTIGEDLSWVISQEIAYALIQADALWPAKGYRLPALEILAALRGNLSACLDAHPTEGYRPVAYYASFSELTGDKIWENHRASWLSSLVHSSERGPAHHPTCTVSLQTLPFSWHLWRDMRLNATYPALLHFLPAARFLQNQGLAKLRNAYDRYGHAVSEELTAAGVAHAALILSVQPEHPAYEEAIRALVHWQPESHADALWRLTVLKDLDRFPPMTPLDVYRHHAEDAQSGP